MGRKAVLARGRTALTTVAVMGLELAWVFTLLHTAAEGLHLDLSLSPLLAVYAVSFALSLVLSATRRSARVAIVVSWLAWPLATLALLVAMFRGFGGIADSAGETVFVTVASGMLWWLGGSVTGGRLTYKTVMNRFGLGLVILAASLLAGYLAHVAQPAAVPTAIVFVGLGLLGIAVARAEERGGAPFGRRGGTWWGILLVSLLLVLLLGLLAAVIFTPGLIHLVAQGFRELWGLVTKVFAAIARVFPSSCSDKELSPGVQPPLPQGGESGPNVGLPHWLSILLNIVYVVGVGGLVLAAVWRVASQLFERMRRVGGEVVQRESLRGAFRLDLVHLLRRLLAWLAVVVSFGRHRAKPHGETAPTASMRRLYAEMLRWGAASGFPRGRSETPSEYQRTLCAELPAHQTDVASITEGYVRARYAAQPPTEAELHQLRESRRRLKRRAGATKGKRGEAPHHRQGRGT